MPPLPLPLKETLTYRDLINCDCIMIWQIVYQIIIWLHSPHQLHWWLQVSYVVIEGVQYLYDLLMKPNVKLSSDAIVITNNIRNIDNERDSTVLYWLHYLHIYKYIYLNKKCYTIYTQTFLTIIFIF